MQRAVLWIMLASLACQREFSVPAPVAPPAVTVKSFAPLHGYAGTLVTIAGTQLGANIAVTQVRFGTSLPTAPLSVDAAGTSMVVAVPDDATDGLLTVIAPKGQAASAQPFKFDGLGHLRLNAVTATADLRPTFTAAFPIGAEIALIAFGAGWAGRLQPDGSLIGVSEAGTLDAMVFATNAGTDGTLWTVDHSKAGCGGNLRVLRVGDKVPICLGANASFVRPMAAIDPEGTHLVVTVENGGWLIDLAGGIVKPFDTSLSVTSLVAYDAATHFVLVDPDGIHRLDWTQDPPLGTATAPLPSGYYPKALAVVPGVKAVVCDAGDRVAFYALNSTWPPAGPTAESSTYAFDPEGAAFSPDGNRLVVASASSGKAVVLDVTNPAQPPIASVDIERAGVPAAGFDGVFLVPARGGFTTISQANGTVLDRQAVSSALRSPLVRTIAQGTATLEVVEVASHRLNSLMRLKAETLAAALLDTISLDSPEVDELAAAHGGPLYLRHGSEVRKLIVNADGIEVESPQRWKPPVSALNGRAPQLTVSPDGSAVMLRFNETGADTPQWKVALLDPAQAWSAAYSPPAFPLSTTPAFDGLALADDQGNLALVGDTQAEIVQLPAALRGTLTSVAQSPILTSKTPVAADLALGSLFVVESDPAELAGTLQMVPAPAQPPPTFDSWDEFDSSAFHVAPGGRRIWMLRGEGAARRLVTVEFDPETGTALREEPPVSLPAGASILLPFAGGTRLLVVDTVNDGVLLLK